jgi:hypothetical protein
MKAVVRTHVVLGLMLATGSALKISASPVVAAHGDSLPHRDYGVPYELSNAITASSGLAQSSIDGITDFGVLLSAASYNGFDGPTFTFSLLPEYYLFEDGSTRTVASSAAFLVRSSVFGTPSIARDHFEQHHQKVEGNARIPLLPDLKRQGD